MERTLLEIHDLLIGQSLQFYYEVGAVSRVWPGEVVAWRAMPCANMAYISGGSWEIEREDIGKYSVYSGESCCIPAGIRHRTVMVSEGTSESRWAHFSVLLYEYIDLFSFFDLPAVLQGEAAEEQGEILSRLGQLSHTEEPFALLLNRKVLEFQLAASLISHSTPKYHSDLRLQQIQRVLPVLKAIDENLAEPHTRESLASLASFSPSRFATVFREAVGISPIDYVVKLRMQRARQHLLGSDFSIEQIALQVGYRDAFYFSRLFKMHYGLSPKKYQSQYANIQGTSGVLTKPP